MKKYPLLQLEHKADAAAILLQAMGNSKRLLLLHYMAQKEITVNDLAKATGLSASATSQHLAKLNAANLVVRRRESQAIYYKVASQHVRKLLDYFIAIS